MKSLSPHNFFLNHSKFCICLFIPTKLTTTGINKDSLSLAATPQKIMIRKFISECIYYSDETPFKQINILYNPFIFHEKQFPMAICI